ncbi:hypothetical protein AB4305_30240 [Nocardia sp. 2YAB30]|uniref:hypothetical protein n=1 Tax=Nocardia sp. 2YAB30 TaxID=3233022 RepID=UPI003F9E584B
MSFGDMPETCFSKNDEGARLPGGFDDTSFEFLRLNGFDGDDLDGLGQLDQRHANVTLSAGINRIQRDSLGS